jgi:hypothetical protein
MANTPPEAKRPASHQQDATSSAKPVATVRFGAISAAIFSEQRNVPSGTTLTFYRVSVRRSYKDRTSGEFKHTHTLDAADLLPAARALERAYEMIADMDSSVE